MVRVPVGLKPGEPRQMGRREDLVAAPSSVAVAEPAFAVEGTALGMAALAHTAAASARAAGIAACTEAAVAVDKLVIEGHVVVQGAAADAPLGVFAGTVAHTFVHMSGQGRLARPDFCHGLFGRVAAGHAEVSEAVEGQWVDRRGTRQVAAGRIETIVLAVPCSHSVHAEERAHSACLEAALLAKAAEVVHPS